TGVQGDTGATGITGPTGVQGDTGVQGGTGVVTPTPLYFADPIPLQDDRTLGLNSSSDTGGGLSTEAFFRVAYVVPYDAIYTDMVIGDKADATTGAATFQGILTIKYASPLNYTVISSDSISPVICATGREYADALILPPLNVTQG